MKIAQVAPLFESCPPRLYGGTERVVSYLTEELVRQGHKVTLYASGDSQTRAELRTVCPIALRLGDGYGASLAYHIVMADKVQREAGEFDIVHFHTDYLHFPLFRHRWHNTVTTLHGRLDLKELPAVFSAFPHMPVVSISDAQREPLPWLHWQGTVHHGLPPRAFVPGSGKGGYLAFLGRISPEKRPDRAIRIAERAGVKLRIAAKVDSADGAYFETVIRPMLTSPLVEFVGEIGEAEKAEFLGGALALLFPIDWPEPFGLVMVEAMACGTPVIAFGAGSVPEVVEPGITGFIVGSEKEAAVAVELAAALDRGTVRRRCEARFSARRMAEDYLAIYARLAAQPRTGLALGTSVFASGSDSVSGHA